MAIDRKHLIGLTACFWNWEERANFKKPEYHIWTLPVMFSSIPSGKAAGIELQFAKLKSIIQKSVSVLIMQTLFTCRHEKSVTYWGTDYAFLSCTTAGCCSHVSSARALPNSVCWVGCIIESTECVGAPLLCSRLTESGPVSEAAQADSIERLAPFEVNWIQYPNAKLRLSRRDATEQSKVS